MAITSEQWAILKAPVPTSQIKSYPGRGGKEMRYTSVEFVESRLAEVDPNFEKRVQLGTKGITVHYTVLGVTRGDAFDYDNEKTEGGNKAFGTPVTNGLARACRRAAKQFGVAADLWEDSPVDEVAAKREGKGKPAAAAAASTSFLNEKQQGLLRSLGVNQATINSLTKKQVNSAQYGGLDIIGKLKDAGAKTEAAAKKVLTKNHITWVEDEDVEEDDYLDDEDEDEEE